MHFTEKNGESSAAFGEYTVADSSRSRGPTGVYRGAKLQTSADHVDQLESATFVLELAPGGGEIDIRLLF